MRNKKLYFRIIFGLIIIILLNSCKEETLPKPKAFLRLEYPNNNYQLTQTLPYQFETSKKTTVLVNSKYWMKIKYPKLNASIDITYRPIKNNILELLLEAEKLTTKHATKADAIYSEVFEDNTNKVYGKLNNVTGNAASPLQFHVTDSVQHFITGAVYFNTQPNYDSIYPAIKHIEKDLIHLMSTTKWKSNSQ